VYCNSILVCCHVSQLLLLLHQFMKTAYLQHLLSQFQLPLKKSTDMCIPPCSSSMTTTIGFYRVNVTYAFTLPIICFEQCSKSKTKQQQKLMLCTQISLHAQCFIRCPLFHGTERNGTELNRPLKCGTEHNVDVSKNDD